MAHVIAHFHLLDLAPLGQAEAGKVRPVIEGFHHRGRLEGFHQVQQVIGRRPVG